MDTQDNPPKSKLYSLPTPHGSHVEHVLNVGPEKPLGYVTYKDIAKSGLTPEALRQQLESRNIRVVELGHGPSYSQTVNLERFESVRVDKPIRLGSRGPLFYAYDEASLRALLETPRAQEVLKEAGWQATPEGFIEHIHRCLAAPKTPLFDLISDAFGSHLHAGRTDQVDTHPDIQLERFRNAPTLQHHDLPVKVLKSGYDPENGDVHDMMLRGSPTVSADSAEHYNTQYRAQRGEHPGDWRDQLEAKRREIKNSEKDPKRNR
ncbi:MAG: hypothetical protein EBV03_04660 [Proteobacteria bacterium]|nr:hypothetical protein [Pseudomonadota bacterium]